MADIVAAPDTIQEIGRTIDAAKRKVQEYVKAWQQGTLKKEPGCTMQQVFEMKVCIRKTESQHLVYY